MSVMDGTGCPSLVVGLADDDASWSALRWATASAARAGGAVHVVRAIRDEVEGSVAGCSAGTDRALAETELAAVRRLAARAAEAVGAPAPPPVSLSRSPGRASDVLLAAARGGAALVVGRPARRGRTVATLLAGAPGPVTVVAPSVGAAGARHVVVGVDPTAGSTAASLPEIVATTVGHVLQRSRDGDRVTVVAGFHPVPVPGDWPHGYRPSPTIGEQVRAVQESTLAVVTPTVQRLRRDDACRGVAVEVLGWPQESPRAVLEAVRDLGADELVVPQVGVWSPSSLLRLARVAPCPVTALPGPVTLRTTIPGPRAAPARGDLAVPG
ncbi:universal stress protein [Actinomycetospora straminea]|uniref:UspA domain-containing protein n=1 Tax=Actinomycetospora straminea TaxID=663607 RepID=A0ABP9ET38_9PSEU|nr:universal stress protein [Actinomycetospora straminea]MDD7933153.1 universal stress protein [Actinomycetospora straminea]